MTSILVFGLEVLEVHVVIRSYPQISKKPEITQLNLKIQ